MGDFRERIPRSILPAERPGDAEHRPPARRAGGHQRDGRSQGAGADQGVGGKPEGATGGKGNGRSGQLREGHVPREHEP